MIRTVEWARSALDDVKKQIAYIAAENPAAARRVADALRDVGNALGVLPSGHPGRIAGIYEKSVTGLPYIIAYSLSDKNDMLSIVRVIHTSRNWQPNQWPT